MLALGCIRSGGGDGERERRDAGGGDGEFEH